jgi:hypothetical protein
MGGRARFSMLAVMVLLAGLLVPVPAAKAQVVGGADRRPAAAPAAAGVVPLPPARLVDSRIGQGLAGRLAAQATSAVRVNGVGGVPSSGVAAVLLTVTVVQPQAVGHLTVWPSGTVRPDTSNVNFQAGQDIATTVLVAIGGDGRVDVFSGTTGDLDLVVDVSGYLPAGPPGPGSVVPSAPTRLVDSRIGLGIAAALAPAGTARLLVTGVGGVPSTGVAAVVLTVTAVAPRAVGFLSVFPSGTARPLSSNLNFQAGQNIANTVLVPVGPDGRVQVFNGSSGGTDLVIDIAGHVVGGSPVGPGGLVATLPSRVVDSRTGQGIAGPAAPTRSVSFQVAGVGGVPASGVAAVLLNVTAVGPLAPGHLTLWASGSVRPGTSNVNFRPAENIANTVLAPVGPDGRVQLFNGSPGAVDVVVDVNGYVSGPADSSAVDKVLIIVEENHGFAAMTAHMPYLMTQARRYGYATNFRALTHPSLPNYLALAAGSTFGVSTDCSVARCPQSGPTVFDQAIAAGRTAKVYAEDMSVNCQPSGWGDGLYAVRHTAWPYFTDATSRSNCNRFQVPAGATGGPFRSDVRSGALPTVGWLIPNLCNDAHQPECPLARADSWLRSVLPAIVAGPDWRSGRLAVVVTADEDEGTADNNILTVVMHPSLHGRVVDTALNTYSLTRFQEQVAGVPYLGKARTAADFGSAFGLTATN